MRSVQTSNQSIMVIASVYAVFCVLYAPETDTKSKMRRINAAIYVYGGWDAGIENNTPNIQPLTIDEIWWRLLLHSTLSLTSVATECIQYSPIRSLIWRIRFDLDFIFVNFNIHNFLLFSSRRFELVCLCILHFGPNVVKTAPKKSMYRYWKYRSSIVCALINNDHICSFLSATATAADGVDDDDALP